MRVLAFHLLQAVLLAAPIKPVNADSDGLAVKGYDPVAYFAESKPVKGLKEFELKHDGATYRFSTAANRDLFKANPAKYLPQYGGYCAWAVSKGHTANISPNAWKVVDGKLYLNHPFAKGKFEKGYVEAIPRADKNWPGILAGK
ncbi:MAG: YHS domain-containing (seleno)protein [Bryobacteraceae bacterium]